MSNRLEYFKNRPVIYHGTTETFVADSVRKTGRLVREEPLYLSDGISNGIGYAIQRARYYDDKPLILAISTDIVLPRLIFDGQEPRIDYLDPSEYVSMVFDPSNFEKVPQRIKELFKEKFGFFSF